MVLSLSYQLLLWIAGWGPSRDLKFEVIMVLKTFSSATICGSFAKLKSFDSMYKLEIQSFIVLGEDA